MDTLSSARTIEEFLQISEENFDQLLDLWLAHETNEGIEFQARVLDYQVPGLSGQVTESFHPAAVAISSKTPVWIVRLSEMHSSVQQYISIWEEELQSQQVFAIPLPNHPTMCIVGSAAQENFLIGSTKDFLLRTINDFDERLKDLISSEARIIETSNIISRLTARQQTIIRHIGKGFTNNEIASELGVSLSTVGSEVRKVNANLGFTRRAELIRFALENRLG